MPNLKSFQVLSVSNPPLVFTNDAIQRDSVWRLCTGSSCDGGPFVPEPILVVIHWDFSSNRWSLGLLCKSAKVKKINSSFRLWGLNLWWRPLYATAHPGLRSYSISLVTGDLFVFRWKVKCRNILIIQSYIKWKVITYTGKRVSIYHLLAED